MKVYGVIYLLINAINDKEYVGQTTKTAEERFKEHMYSPHCIGNAIRKHGAENFVIAILKVCYSKAELNFWEKHFIKSRNTLSPCGYNLTEGGAGSGKFIVSKGRKFTPEHCAKISASKMGHEVSKETRAILSAINKGKPQTAEAREKNVAAHLGEKNHFFGKHHTGDAIMKNSLAHRGETPYKNLVAELDARQISYNKLAELLGLSQSHISNKMRGKKIFKPEEMIAIKNLLGAKMSVEEFFKHFGD